MLSFTTGSHETMFSSNGINGDMNVTLWPVQVRSFIPYSFTSTRLNFACFDFACHINLGLLC